MTQVVPPVSPPKRGNVCTSKEGEIVIKEEIVDETPLVEVQIKHETDHQDDDGVPYLAGDLVQVTIKEEDGEVVTTATSNLPSTPTSPTQTCPYKCPLCPASFSDYNLSLEHIHGHTVYSNVASEYLAQQAKLMAPTIAPKHPYICTVCRATFPYFNYFAQHQRMHRFYDRIFPPKDNTRKTEEPPSEPVVNTKKPSNPPSTTAQPSTSASPPKPAPYQCSICQASFSNSHLALEHIREHSYRKNHRCLTCNRLFYSKGQLETHGKAHQADDQQTGSSKPTTPAPNWGPYPCSICHASFSSSQLASEHISGHSKGRSHFCPICRRAFYSSGELAQHREAHQQAARAPLLFSLSSPSHPYSCTLCLRTFTHLTHLEKHKVAHPFYGEAMNEDTAGPGILKQTRKFVCEYCGLSFGLRESHRLHQREHMKERPYLFALCTGTFRCRYSRDAHVKKVHGKAAKRPVGRVYPKRRQASLKRVPCPQCSRQFTWKTDLARHVKEHHEGASPWSCAQCGGLYGGKEALARHRSIEHGQGQLHKAKRRKVKKMEKETAEEAEVFQHQPGAQEEDEDDEEEEIIFCKTIR